MENNIGNTRIMKKNNLKSIFKLIFRKGPISRKELAETTDYSQATISNHVKTLINKEYVIETEKGYSTGGRKPVYLTINPARNYILGIDIKVNKVKFILFNLKFKIEDTDTIIPEDPADVETVIGLIHKKIKEILPRNGLKFDNILGLGISVPGLLDKKKENLILAPNLEWKNVNIIERFREQYEVPIVLENEANAATIGEREIVYPMAGNMVYVSINEGIGCGIVFNGELYRGASGNAGEFGHIIIDSKGPECHCGSHGCWETMASENYIINSYEKLKDENKKKDEIYREGKKGEKEVIAIFKQTGRHIGIGLVNIVNSLSPRLLVIGGNITKIRDYIDEEIKFELKQEALTANMGKVEIKYSKLGDQAAIYGSAFMIFNNFIEL